MILSKWRQLAVAAAISLIVVGACGEASVTRSPDEPEPGETTLEPIGETPNVTATVPPVEPSTPVDSPQTQEPPPPEPIDDPDPETPEPTPEPPPEPVAEGFECENALIDDLSFLESGWHDGTEVKWDNLGCLGTYQIAAPHMAVICSADALNGGWMSYGISDPSTLEPNFPADADPDIQYRLWMTTLLWFQDADKKSIAYQLPWTYTTLFAEQNLATGSFHWDKSGQWFDDAGQLVYDTFNARRLDTRTITTAPARAFAVSYLLFWPASNFNGRGAAFSTVALHGVGYCDI